MFAVPGSIPRTITIALILRRGADAFALALGVVLWFRFCRMGEEDGYAISYQALRRGTKVRAADGTEVGTVRRVQDKGRVRRSPPRGGARRRR